MSSEINASTTRFRCFCSVSSLALAVVVSEIDRSGFQRGRRPNSCRISLPGRRQRGAADVPAQERRSRNHTEVKKIKALLGLNGTSDPVLLKQLNAAHDGVNGNPAFPAPTVDMPTFKAGIDKLVDCSGYGRRRWRQEGHFREKEATCGNDQAVHVAGALR